MHNVKSNTPEHVRDWWATPDELVRGLLVFLKETSLVPMSSRFVLDACAATYNTKAPKWFTTQDSAFNHDWSETATGVKDLVWCNPPYSRGLKQQFVEKIINEAEKGVCTVVLLPNDTSSKWFAQLLKVSRAVIFITEGRISFINPTTRTPIGGNTTGSTVFVVGPHKKPFAQTFYAERDLLYSLGEENDTN